MISNNYTENLIRQFKEFNETGLRTVECPECGAELETEVDNDYAYCPVCEKRVKVGRII